MITQHLMPFRRPALARHPACAVRAPFGSLNSDFDRLFNALIPTTFRGVLPSLENGSKASGFVPNVDIRENAEQIQITVELPGIDEKEVKVQLDADRLVITGEKQRGNTKEKDVDYSHHERTYGSFERVIRLETEVEADKVKATFRNGVLEISLPKLTPEKEVSREIKVVTG